jgi:hypothetical protein
VLGRFTQFFSISFSFTSGFPPVAKSGSSDETKSSYERVSLMPFPDCQNIIPFEVGTASRQGERGLSAFLRDFHKALEARDVVARSKDTKNPRAQPRKKSARKSIGVSYNTNSRVDGVLMFWNPEEFFEPYCLLFNQIRFRFAYPPYICQWQHKVSKNANDLYLVYNLTNVLEMVTEEWPGLDNNRGPHHVHPEKETQVPSVVSFSVSMSRG